MSAAGDVTIHIVLGAVPWIADDNSKPDGRWLGRTDDGRVTLVRRRGGQVTYAFQPIDFTEAVQLAHRVIAGDERTITDPLSLAALAAVVAELGMHAPQAEESA